MIIYLDVKYTNKVIINTINYKYESIRIITGKYEGYLISQ